MKKRTQKSLGKKTKKPVKKSSAQKKSAPLQQQLQELWRQLDLKMRGDFNRSLPFTELLNDRWQRAKGLGFASGASIYGTSLVFGDVHVGEKSWVGPYTVLDGSGGRITVGKFCNISIGAQIYTHDTVYWCLSAGEIPASKGEVRIGDCTYIGPNCVVQRNVTIGDHCIIGANSFVNRSIPPYSFACGTPCRVQGRIVKAADGSWRVESETERTT